MIYGELNIGRVNNGYIIIEDGDDDEKNILVVEEMENANFDLEQLQAMRRVLWEVIEYFGMVGSKHDKHRLRVAIINQEDGEEIE